MRKPVSGGLLIFALEFLVSSSVLAQVPLWSVDEASVCLGGSVWFVLIDSWAFVIPFMPFHLITAVANVWRSSLILVELI